MNNYIAEHIIAHTKDCSLLLIKNGETMVSINEHINRPLASIYKLVILLAYVDQCKKGTIHPDDQVHFSQLKRCWIHWVDPSFLKWYNAMKEENKIMKNCVALNEVVKGMIQFSCNANTDYLLATLGIDAVNKQLVADGMNDHDPIVPICTSVLVSLKDAKIDHTPSSLGKVSQECFEHMLKGNKIKGLDLNLLNDFDYKMQCRWSDLLPHASVHTYGKVVKKIQDLHKDHREVEEVMDWYGKLKTYKGFKGGIKLGFTPKVFNVALYTSDSFGNEYQLVYFLNNLSVDQKQVIELASNDFNLKILKEPFFVNQLKNQVVHVNI